MNHWIEFLGYKDDTHCPKNSQVFLGEKHIMTQIHSTGHYLASFSRFVMKLSVWA